MAGSWFVPSCLLSYVGDYGTVAGDYYGISAKGTMGRVDDSRKLRYNRPDVMVYFEKSILP